MNGFTNGDLKFDVAEWTSYVAGLIRSLAKQPAVTAVNLHNFVRKTKLFLLLIAWLTREIQLHGIICMINGVSDRERTAVNNCDDHHGRNYRNLFCITMNLQSIPLIINSRIKRSMF